MTSSASRRRYAIDQSPLFALRGKGRFEKALGIKWDSVPELLGSDAYRVWLNEKNREIQAPINWMAAMHKNIGDLLARIEVPDYVFSQKGRSYADNAQKHVGNHPVIKTDIHKFYPSVTREMVFGTFFRDFSCAADIADRLADICCFKQQHLPTGSPLSGRLAFFAARPLFDDIAMLAQANDCTFTIYVDDIVLSGPSATKALLGQVRTLISRHGLKSKNKKSKTFAHGAPKCVTGAVIVGDRLKLPNARHLKMRDAHNALVAANDEDRESLKMQYVGRRQEAKQVLLAGTKSKGSS